MRCADTSLSLAVLAGARTAHVECRVGPRFSLGAHCHDVTALGDVQARLAVAVRPTRRQTEARRRCSRAGQGNNRHQIRREIADWLNREAKFKDSSDLSPM